MLLPIYGYGQPVLKKTTEEIGPDYPELDQLISNMWETMYHAQGVGLAAPQVGKPIRLFMVDTIQIMEKGSEDEGIKRVFINAQILEEAGAPWTYEEGCLSIPDIRGDVERPPQIRLRYQDEDFVEREEVFTGMNARVIQHEYDHVDGVLFVEHLKPIKRRLIRRRLDKVRKGQVEVDYKMKFASR
ncbi:MAG: peptide deformylase [Saprospiraceae bacterium]|nr:peptide deformylase [Saprospiraceae bacterium]